MSLLTTDHATEIIHLLEKERNNGSQYIILETRPMDAQLKPHDLEFFKTLNDALDYLNEKERHEYVPGFGADEHPLYYQPIDKFLEEIRQANALTGKDVMQQLGSQLTEAGYDMWSFKLMQDAYRHGHDELHFMHRNFIGRDLIGVHLYFNNKDGDIRFREGDAYLLAVPIENKVIGGIDIAELDGRMNKVAWSQDYLGIYEELPKDKANNQLVEVTIPGIFSDLERLHGHSEQGAAMAERLVARNMAWGHLDQNHPYMKAMEDKYVVTTPVHQIDKLQDVYQRLQAIPQKSIDLSRQNLDFITQQQGYYLRTIKKGKTMNLNNLQDLRKEVAGLGFSPKAADELEKNMRALPQHFTIKDQLPGDRGQVDLTLHFHKSGVSDMYNFGKFEATAGKVPPTPANQSYMVLTENKDNKEKPLVKTFDSPNEAIDFFKKQKGKSELALGESPEAKQTLASRENGKENFVHDDFRGAYYSPAIKQTFYLKEGAGFTASQAANMVQGRTVHRDNMLNPRSGEQYQAWIKLDTAQGKDDWGNFKLKQMNDPAFGFNLEKALKDFKIMELSDPAKKEAIVSAIKNGDRVEVTAVNREGKDVKVKMEADPQFKTLNFFTEKGTREKREQYKKPDVAQSQGRRQGKAKEKELEQGQGVGIR